jgi:hypothetical protein
MAHTLLDGGFANYPDAWDFELSMNVFSTVPVGQAEAGITPNLETPFNFPTLYEGSPVLAGNLVLDEIGGAGSGLIFATNIPAPPGPAVTSSAALTGLSGLICPLYEEDLYGRIIIQPVSIDFGNVLQQQSRTVEVWNSFTSSKTLNAITEAGTIGLTLFRPASAPSEPAVYAGLQSRIYTLQADTVGPAAIDATYDFDFAPDFSPTLFAIGQRVIAFPYCYERPFRETLEFRTDVIESENGSEQRISARQLPRQLFRAEYLITDSNERQRALNAIYGFHGNFFAVPLFHWARPLDAAAAINDTTIFVDYANADFRDTTLQKERLIMLWRSPTDFEISQVGLNGLTTPGQIDVELPLTQNHTAGDTLVVPLQFALPKDPFQFEETTNNIVTISADWLSNDYADLGDLSSLPVLDGIPVMGAKNLVDGGRLQQGFRIKYDLQDSQTGDFIAIADRTVPEPRTFLGIEVSTEAEAWVIRQIIYGLKGRQKSFWLPTFRDDFTVTQDIGAGDLSILFSENDFHRFVEDGPDPWGGIYIELFDGTQFFRTITGTTAAVAGEEAVAINASLGQAVTVADIRMMSILTRSRFNQDRISIQHTRIGNIKLRIPVVGVKESV